MLQAVLSNETHSKTRVLSTAYSVTICKVQPRDLDLDLEQEELWAGFFGSEELAPQKVRSLQIPQSLMIFDLSLSRPSLSLLFFGAELEEALPSVSLLCQGIKKEAERAN